MFLVPFWGLGVLPMMMQTFRLLQAPPVPTYFVMIGLLLTYFVRDLLCREVRISRDKLHFGFSSFKLNELASLGLEYAKDRTVPSHIICSFTSGNKLRLRMQRLSAEDLENFISYVETKLPHCQIEPVLRTLSRCQKLARDTNINTADLIEIPYHSRLFLQQMAHAFMQHAEKWSKVGPVVALVLLSPMWLALVGWLMMPLQYTSNKTLGTDLAAAAGSFEVNLLGFLGDWCKIFLQGITSGVGLSISWMIFLILATFLIRSLLRPNLLLLEKNGFKFCHRLLFVLTTQTIRWDSLTVAALSKGRGPFGHQAWTILLYCGNRRPIKLMMDAISPDHRIRLLNAIQRWAPQCEISSELAETLLPKQNRSYTELWLQSLSTPPERRNLEPLGPKQTLQQGRYEVIRSLGVGGQGRAYLCAELSQVDESQCQEVVLKETILPVYVQNSIRQEALEHFQQEARMLQSLDTDRIVRLRDYFIEDHRGYLVLEHIAGHNLRDITLMEGALHENEALHLAEQMAQILQHLHQRNIIHRDFTPDNLMLGKNRTLKLLDFNVAQQVGSGTTGSIVGKQAYIPPEQFRGKATFQSDIYALGATLFFLTTGKDPDPLSESDPGLYNPHLSQSFRYFILQCTRLNANKRFASADVLLATVSALLNGQEIEGAQEELTNAREHDRDSRMPGPLAAHSLASASTQRNEEQSEEVSAGSATEQDGIILNMKETLIREFVEADHG